MKNLKKLIFVFSVTLLFISCNNDESVLQIENSQILGTWNLTELTEDGTTTTSSQGIDITATFSAYGKNINAEVTFTENPNKFASSGSYTSVITTEILGQQTVQEVPINNFIGSGDWEINGNIMIVTANSEESTVEILELNESMLKLKITEEIESSFQSTVINTKVTAYYTLTK